MMEPYRYLHTPRSCKPRRRGPEEHSVTGFDGVEEGARFWPSLTTAEQPMEQLGRAAVAALLDRIDDPESDVAVTIEYPMPLALRESSGPAPGAKRARSATA